MQYASAGYPIPDGTVRDPLPPQEPRIHVMPDWKRVSDKERVRRLREIVVSYSRHPHIVGTAVAILRGAGVAPRDYRGQAAALLAWVQHNIYYANERDERIQSPDYTLKVRFGDCDDEAVLLAALYDSIRLPWRFVLSGGDPDTGARTRWIEGTPTRWGEKYAHIYVMVGWPPFHPREWAFAEPTLRGAPLGWDVMQARRGAGPLPELSGPWSGWGYTATATYSAPGPSTASSASAAATMPIKTVPAGIAAAVEQALRRRRPWLQTVATAIVVGTLTSVLANLSMIYVRRRLRIRAK